MDITKCTFLNFASEGRTETLQLTYIPQMLSAYIPCKYIYYQMLPNSWAHRNPLTDTFPPIVGMIYPIPIYINTTDMYSSNLNTNINITKYIFVLDIFCQKLEKYMSVGEFL